MQARSFAMSALLQDYEDKVQRGKLKKDPAQEAFVKVLQAFLLQSVGFKEKDSWFAKKKKAPAGIYVYGKVGVGKTMLLDLFLSHYPHRCLRMHFYAFMAKVHKQLSNLRGVKNSMEKVIADFKQQADMLFLDEFLVEDIADASLLKNILEISAKMGMSIITSGNTAPEDLYKDGFARDRFLPAITHIKKNMEVFHLDHDVDYRNHTPLEKLPYVLKMHKENDPILEETFASYSQKAFTYSQFDQTKIFNQRTFAIRGCNKRLVWFEIDTLCHQMRAPEDFMAIVESYDCIMLSSLKTFSGDDAARRFMSLVDIAYDRKTPLILLSYVDIAALYSGKRLQEAFKRTTSRLKDQAQFFKRLD